MVNVFQMPLVRGEWCVVPPGAHRTPGPQREEPRTTHHAFYFLDLPGYGYARASQSERIAFRRLVDGALERPRLKGVLWLLDIRREPSDHDRAMQDLLAAGGTRVLAAVTKSDKLPRGERERRARELRAALALDADQLIVTSALAGSGVPELSEAVAGLVAAQ